ncbi:hypothetical protein F5Y16DRAFT_378228 [Xylariaceae sp. FL0255]|nr:hypothetical protein F5Y16DRAFT_378228 [Xylariaceae sp. FL0255]
MRPEANGRRLPDSSRVQGLLALLALLANSINLCVTISVASVVSIRPSMRDQKLCFHENLSLPNSKPVSEICLSMYGVYMHTRTISGICELTMACSLFARRENGTLIPHIERFGM